MKPGLLAAFLVAAIIAAGVVLFLRKEPGASAPAPPTKEAEKALQGAPPAPEPAEAPPLPVASVAGMVLEMGTGKPLGGARVDAGSRESIADAAGVFRLEGLVPGRIDVAAVAEGRAARWLAVDAWPGEEPWLVFRLPPGGTIAGRVTDGAGKPREGVTVSCEAGGGTFEAVSDAEGRYRLEGVPLGATNIPVQASQLPFLHGESEMAGFAKGETAIALDIVLDGGSMVLAGKVIDSEGRAIEGAELDLDGHAAGTSDGDGAFRIEGVLESLNPLRARKAGFAPARMDIEGLDEEARENIELVLEPGRFLAGRVVDATGAPLDEVWVSHDEGGALTDLEGRFQLDDLRDGPLEIEATLEGYLVEELVAEELDRDDLEIVLEEAGEIRGVVVEARSGQPVKEFTAQAGEDGQEVRFSSPQGAFVLRDLVPGRSYEVIVDSEEHVPGLVEEVEARPRSSGSDPIRVTLDAGKTITGKVTARSTGGALDAVEIDFEGRQTSSRPDGSFELKGLQATPGGVVFQKPGFARAYRGTTPGGETLVITLDAEAVVEGRVRDAGGEAIEGASVQVMAGAGIEGHSRTRSSGSFRIAALGPGRKLLVVSLEGFLPQEKLLHLSPGKLETIEVEVPAGSIAGRVTRRGEAVSGVDLEVEGISGSQRGHITVEDGRYRIGGAAPGVYRLRLESGVERTVEVGGGEAVCDLEVPTGRVAGRVKGAEGTDRDEITVSLRARSRRNRLFPGFFLREEGWQAIESTNGREFEFEGLPAGSYLIVVHTGDRKAGWSRPLELKEGAAVEDVEVVVEAGRNPFAPGGPDAPPGGSTPPGTTVAVELTPPLLPAEAYQITATQLSGADPGWPFQTGDGSRPVAVGLVLLRFPGPRIAKLPTRPGRHRVRLEVSEVLDRPGYLPRHPLLTRELEVDVPAQGEARVRLELPPD